METKQTHKLDLSKGYFIQFLVYLDKIEAGHDSEANKSIMGSCLDYAKQHYLDNLETTLGITGENARELWDKDAVEFRKNSLKNYTHTQTGKVYSRYYYPFYLNLLEKWHQQLLQHRKDNLQDLKNIQSLSYHEYKPQELSDMIGSNMDDAAEIREQVIECITQKSMNTYNAVPYEEAVRVATFYWMSMLEDEKESFWNK